MNQVSYCAVHNTYPEAGEPCWACANPFIQKAYEEGLEHRVPTDEGEARTQTKEKIKIERKKEEIERKKEKIKKEITLFSIIAAILITIACATISAIIGV